MQKKHSRSKKLINPRFQLKFALSCLVPMLIMCTVFWLALESFIAKMIRMGKAQGLQDNHEFFRLIEAQRYELLQILVLFSLFVAVVFFIWGLFYSHKIAGPLAKLTHWLNSTKDLESARENPVQFRSDDYFKEIAESINQFLKKL